MSKLMADVEFWKQVEELEKLAGQRTYTEGYCFEGEMGDSEADQAFTMAAANACPDLIAKLREARIEIETLTVKGKDLCEKLGTAMMELREAKALLKRADDIISRVTSIELYHRDPALLADLATFLGDTTTRREG